MTREGDRQSARKRGQRGEGDGVEDQAFASGAQGMNDEYAVIDRQCAEDDSRRHDGDVDSFPECAEKSGSEEN